ncbi:unnamed protein product [Withania somnifera]
MASINQQGAMDLEMGLPQALQPISNMNSTGEASSSPSPRAPALVVSHSSKTLVPSNSGKALFVSNSGKALLLSNSGKRMDPSGKKKYVKQVTGRHNDTELHLAAQRGDVGAVREIVGEIDEQMLKTMSGAEFDAEVAEIREAMVNEVNELGETALFTAAERGYIDVVKELLPYSTKEGITAKNRSGLDPLHIAANQGHQGNKHLCIVHELLVVDNTNVNALTRDHRTALDIAEGLPMSEESTELKENLTRYGACRANELNQPRDELRKTVTEIKKNVHSQLEQARKTNKNMTGIAKELHRLHREGINNATNSVTIVASLFATVAFAAIFTVPGGDLDTGYAIASNTPTFKIFYFTNTLALFTSLAVVVVQITVVRGETKSEKRVIGVINKLMWLAAVFTCLAFVSASYVVIGKRNIWAAIFVTVVAGIIMAGVLGAMTYYVVRSKKARKIRKRDKFARTRNYSFQTELSESDFNPYFAL